MPVNGYIGVFSGFTLPNMTTGANVARDLLRTAIGANTQIAQRGTPSLRRSALKGIALIVNDTNTVAWRLYVALPTNNRDFFAQLLKADG
ncbi:hypothetical protein B0H13DRAFT_2308988 [Mycena leptocephala]|nr:hypothetical protein B0H13DRAFT_2308988 [Mycena leptocephala]